MQLICNKEEQERRKQICDSCEHKKEIRCSVCGCFLLALRKWHLPQCPLNKFDIKDEK